MMYIKFKNVTDWDFSKIAKYSKSQAIQQMKPLLDLMLQFASLTSNFSAKKNYSIAVIDDLYENL